MKKIKLKAIIYDDLGRAFDGSIMLNKINLQIVNERGRLIVCLNNFEMERVVKAWVKARGGYPA